MFTLCDRCGGAAKWNGDCYVCGAYNRRFRPKIFRPLVFEEPDSGYQEKAGSPGLWCFLFGPFYLAYKGFWKHAGVLVAVALGFWFGTLVADLSAVAAGQPGASGAPAFLAGLFVLAHLFLQGIYYPLSVRSLLRKRYLAEKGWKEVTSEYIPEEAVI